MSIHAIASCCAALLLTVAATSHAADIPQPYGAPAPAESAQREVRIDPTTKYVNVERAEVVRFVTENGSFAWSFDTDPNRQVFGFDRIAPATQQAQDVRVFIRESTRDR